MTDYTKLKVEELKALVKERAQQRGLNLKISALKVKTDYIKVLNGEIPIPTKCGPVVNKDPKEVKTAITSVVLEVTEPTPNPVTNMTSGRIDLLSNIPATWEDTFLRSSSVLKSIEMELNTGEFYPRLPEVFQAFRLTPLNKVKVVILGQDPYSGTCKDGQSIAIGLAFATRRSERIPASLANIYRELQDEYKDWIPPTHGDLTSWAQQGVLLLNTSLTLKPGQSNSQGQLWLPFIRNVLEDIARVNPKTVVVLWGNNSQKLQKWLGSQMMVLTSAHPSPLSCRRGFFGNNHFRLVNEALTQQGQEPIEWHAISEEYCNLRRRAIVDNTDMMGLVMDLTKLISQYL